MRPFLMRPWDKHWTVYYLGALYALDERYYGYGPNILVLQDGIARKHIR